MYTIWFHATNVFIKTELLPLLLRKGKEKLRLTKLKVTPLIDNNYQFFLATNSLSNELKREQRQMVTKIEKSRRKNKKNGLGKLILQI